jgi:hypothetical protein
MRPSRTEKVLFSITIDTECDHDPRWARSKPLAFESVVRGVPERLQPVFAAHGAVPTYLLTVEVMERRECVKSLRALKDAHELGTHLHAAFVEPQKKFHDYAGIDSPDFQCHSAPDVERQKLANLTDLFVRCFDHRPTSFRAGRFGAGPNTIDALETLGYRVDTSVTPHVHWQNPEGDVDYRGAPEQPYFPAAGTLVDPGASPRTLLEVPVSMQPRWWRGPHWLRPWFTSVDRMKKVVRYHLKKYADRPVIVLNMMFHSMEVVPKASPYPQSDADVTRFLDDLSRVLQWCQSEGVQFSSATALYDEFARRATLP